MNKTRAAHLIREHFEVLQGANSHHLVLTSARDSGRRMVEIYRLLTGELPQVPGIEIAFHADETPAVEWSSPTERDPSEVLYVLPGNPDIILRGDQTNGISSNEREDQRSLGEGQHR